MLLLPLFLVTLRLAGAVFTKPYPDIGLHESQYRCVLDNKVNVHSFASFKDEINALWGTVCGRNRGIFVLDPPDGHTYSCEHLPPSWNISTVNDIADATPEQGVYALNELIKAVYRSSIDKDIGACDFNSLSIFACDREDPWRRVPWVSKLNAPIRAVNIGGLFVLERWIIPTFVDWGSNTGIVDQHSFSKNCGTLGICDVIRDHWHNWYTQKDFDDMKAFKLNTIRLPVGYWYFEEISKYPSGDYVMPHESIYSENHPITKVIRYAKNAGLQIILDLHGAPGGQNGFDNSGETSPFAEADFWGEHWLYDPEHMKGTVDTIAAMTTYINYIESEFGLDNIMIFELLNEPWSMLDIGRVRNFYYEAIQRVREIRPSMPIIIHDSFRPHRWGTLLKNWPFEDVYMDTHMYHGFNIADIASDNPAADRQKMYAHERIACGYKSPLHFQTCNAVPTMVGEFSLAIDNCMPFLDARFKNYGQCDHIKDRFTSPWWFDHIKSFAMRQISTYERELGWAFWTYKLEDHAEKHEPSSAFWSFRLAMEKGFVDSTFYDRVDACMYEPVADFKLGDEAYEQIESSPVPPNVAEEDAATPEVAVPAADASTPTTIVDNSTLVNRRFAIGDFGILVGIVAMAFCAAAYAYVKFKKNEEYHEIPTTIIPFSNTENDTRTNIYSI